MLSLLKQQLEQTFTEALQAQYPSLAIPSVELDIPADPVFGEYSSNVALRSSKIFKKAPMDVAQEFVDVFLKSAQNASWREQVAAVEAKAPGFINFFLTPNALYEILHNILTQREDYGRLTVGQGQKIQVEFVSANPTGTLSVAHARQAVVGDVLVNILNFIGFEATKEFYVNDEGNQINLLGESVFVRAKDILNNTNEAQHLLVDGYYLGDYVIDIARQYLQEKNIGDEEALAQHKELIASYAVDYLMRVIKKDLDDFRVHFDVWAHQSQIATQERILSMMKSLKAQGHVYEAEGAVWFKSSSLGDDKDRVLQKSDGAYTYLTPDIVYHKDKYDRGFKKIFNVWGPDHHGYIPRIKAAVQALGHDPASLEVLIVQLATIYKEGKALSMSTRRGQYISLREVIDEVGVDAARFFFLMRHINCHLDFDLELAKEETPENPVYYIQYAYARIHSIKRKADEAALTFKKDKIFLLVEKEELALIKKLGQFSDALLYCHDQRDPYALINYLQELATTFHKFYDRHKVIDPQLTAENRAPETVKALSAERLALIEAVKIVLANGLTLLGIHTPERM